MINRLKNFLHIIKKNSFKDWRVSFDYCPLCCKNVYFISFCRTALETRCISCRNTCINLAMIPVIDSILPVEYAYEMSSYGGTLEFLRKKVDCIVTSEFYPNYDLGSYFNGVRIEDVQKLTFKSNSFDLVTSNQVFEHVPDDIKGFKEVYRVLKHSGFFVFGVPLYDLGSTKQVAVLTEKGIRFNGKPEYHGSRLEGPNSVPTFWRHSFNDIEDRLEKVGFSAKIVEITVTTIQGSPYKIVKCQK